MHCQCVIASGCASDDAAMEKGCMSLAVVAVLVAGDVAMCVLVIIYRNADRSV